MRTFNKIITSVLAIALVMSMSCTAFAAEVEFFEDTPAATEGNATGGNGGLIEGTYDDMVGVAGDKDINGSQEYEIPGYNPNPDGNIFFETTSPETEETGNNGVGSITDAPIIVTDPEEDEGSDIPADAPLAETKPDSKENDEVPFESAENPKTEVTLPDGRTPIKNPNAFRPLSGFASVKLPFADVAENAWYTSSVKAVYSLGLFSGTSADTFNPQGNLTVAQAIALAARTYANANNETVPAANAGEAWYQGAYDYCVANGIIDAKTWTADKLNANATRYEMASILNGAADESVLVATKDVDSVIDVPADSEYADIVLTWYRAGIVSGTSTGAFEGNRTITRAEVAKILCNLNGVR